MSEQDSSESRRNLSSVAGPCPKGVLIMTSREWMKADPEWCRIETVVYSMTIEEAIQKVTSNHGSAGVDHVSVDELRDYWNKNGETILQKIIEGTYIPLPVKRVNEIF